MEKTLMLAKIEGRRRKEQQRGKMVGCHYRIKGNEFEKPPGDNEGQENLACCSPWGCKESDMIE